MLHSILSQPLECDHKQPVGCILPPPALTECVPCPPACHRGMCPLSHLTSLHHTPIVLTPKTCHWGMLKSGVEQVLEERTAGAAPHLPRDCWRVGSPTDIRLLGHTKMKFSNSYTHVFKLHMCPWPRQPAQPPKN